MSDPNPHYPRVELVSVNVAEPSVIGTFRGKPIRSAIGKQPVEAETLHLSLLNLEGDRQADLRVHGGPDQAVYAYPSEHLLLWTEELERETPFGPGAFGENLTTSGWLEHEVHIGDVWAWGDALLQVVQPRSPCFKLGIVTDRRDVLRRMVANGRTGWYLRVLRAGTVPVVGPIQVVERLPDTISVRDAHFGDT